MPYIDPQTRSVYYRHWKAEHPKAIVLLLHGYGEHSGHYHRLANRLNDVEFDVWAVDHVGHGLSAGERGIFDSVEQLAENARLVADVAKHQHSELPLIILGHSLGGLTAAALAGTLKERFLAGVILTGAPFEGLPDEPLPSELIMSLDEAYLDALQHDPLGFEPAKGEENLWLRIAETRQHLLPSLAASGIPVLMINGELDAFTSPNQVKSFCASIPGASCHIISNGYHDIPNDISHREVVRIIIEQINKWI